jgi:hypothetical protein
MSAAAWLSERVARRSTDEWSSSGAGTSTVSVQVLALTPKHTQAGRAGQADRAPLIVLEALALASWPSDLARTEGVLCPTLGGAGWVLIDGLESPIARPGSAHGLRGRRHVRPSAIVDPQ